MKISIITPCYNCISLIEKTVRSVVIHKNNLDLEYIVIDGKSTDGTLKILSKYKHKFNHLISEKDNGIYFAMNKGVKISKGEIIVFINSGDLFSKNALKIINNIFEKNKKLDFVFGTVRRHYTKSTILKYGFDKNRLRYNFDFATTHSTGFFLKKKYLINTGYSIQNIYVLLIMIYIID